MGCEYWAGINGVGGLYAINAKTNSRCCHAFDSRYDPLGVDSLTDYLAEPGQARIVMGRGERFREHIFLQLDYRDF